MVDTLAPVIGAVFMTAGLCALVVGVVGLISWTRQHTGGSDSR